MKKWGVLLLMFGLIVLAAGCAKNEATKTMNQAEPGPKIKVGVIQIVEHPALDAARKGFLEELAKNNYIEGKNLDVDYQNAQGDQANLQTIAKKFVEGKKDLVLAIATPSAVAMANETTTIPILITAVTDPVSAKLVKDAEKPGTNVTGTSDMNPVADQLQLIKDILPKAKIIGIIYNSSEINSQVQVDLAEKTAPKLGLEAEKVTVTASSEVMQAAQSLAGRIDAYYLPTDNMVISSLAAVIKVAEEKKIPVFVGDTSAVEAGAAATVGIDYNELGKTTGSMALEVIKGKKPQDMAIQYQKGDKLWVNPAAAERMGIKLSDELVKKAEKVIK